MNRRREMAIQRVARIGGLTAVESVTQNAKHKNKASTAFTIEAALGAYMVKDKEVYGADFKDTCTSGQGGRQQNDKDQLSRQMKEYESVLEESRLANAKSEMEAGYSAGQLNIKKFEEALAKDPSAQYQYSRYRKKIGESDFDRLDANRCSGFLLYSYDRKGVHSVLGEHMAPGRHSEAFAGSF